MLKMGARARKTRRERKDERKNRPRRVNFLDERGYQKRGGKDRGWSKNIFEGKVLIARRWMCYFLGDFTGGSGSGASPGQSRAGPGCGPIETSSFRHGGLRRETYHRLPKLEDLSRKHRLTWTCTHPAFEKRLSPRRPGGHAAIVSRSLAA
jgi:hypothetical protein